MRDRDTARPQMTSDMVESEEDGIAMKNIDIEVRDDNNSLHSASKSRSTKRKTSVISFPLTPRSHVCSVHQKQTPSCLYLSFKLKYGRNYSP